MPSRWISAVFAVVIALTPTLLISQPSAAAVKQKTYFTLAAEARSDDACLSMWETLHVYPRWEGGKEPYVNYYIQSFNFCTGQFDIISGFGTGGSVKIKKLKSASLHATLPLQYEDGTPAGSITLNVSWTGVGPVEFLTDEVGARRATVEGLRGSPAGGEIRFSPPFI